MDTKMDPLGPRLEPEVVRRLFDQGAGRSAAADLVSGCLAWLNIVAVSVQRWAANRWISQISGR